MGKKYLIIFIVIVVTIISALVYFFSDTFLQILMPIKNEIKLQTLPGKIILENTIGDGEQKGIVIYTPHTEKKKVILDENVVYNAQLSKDNEKILVCSNSKNYIFEYNLKSKETIPIVKSVTGGISGLSKYTPDEKSFSFADENGLHLVNMLTKMDNLILNNIETISWAKDSSTFLYSIINEDKVYKYNINNKQEQFLFSGYNAQYSNDDKYIAYLPQYMDKVLVIIDQETGEQWKYFTQGGIIGYTFSPDNNYIAIVELSKKILLSPMSGPVVIWDYKKDKKSTLFKNYYGKFIDWK